jgi:iron-sulfur cluster repair protein YtfE (RIC family)
MTDRVVGPLRVARRPLFEGLQSLQRASSAVHADAPGALPAIEEVLGYLHGTFLTLARAEEFTFYPAVDGVIGSVGATDVMTVQHGIIGEMVDDLDRVVEAVRPNGEVAAYAHYLLPLLHGLYAAIRTHLEAEDAVYLALLDEHLSESQVVMLVDNLRRVSAGSAAPL